MSSLDRSSAWQNFAVYYDCPRCGNFGLDETVSEDGQLTDANRIIFRYLLTHPDSNFQRIFQNTPVLTTQDIREYVAQFEEPNALELLDNFLHYYCTAGQIGQRFHENQFELSVATKTLRYEAGKWAITQANSMGWLDDFDVVKGSGGYFSTTFEVSAEGWQTYYENEKDKTQSTQAFLALQFNNQFLREKIVPEIKSACELAGFDLLAVDDNRQAGLIDNKIRVDIRNSRFLVVDISDQNQGAYFEAGFAEGLGKPVFYICDDTVFEKHQRTENRVKTLHFDVEHQDIIRWDKENPERVKEQLLASIRNTLPDDAKMSD